MSSRHWRALVGPALLACILSYSTLLRLDALSKIYGPHREPGWLAVLEQRVTPLSAAITPDWQYRHDDTPYVGGDPINYLRFAREMQSFYAAHVREPMFPASVKLSLALTRNADVGVSVASIAFGLLAVVATYALGAQLASPGVGLAAAAALGIERDAIWWSIGGWRDELFACFAISCAWAWLRLVQRPSRANAVLAGVLSAGACLTRITSLSFIVPAVVWTLGRQPRAMWRHTALAASIIVALASPFLVNCAIATGDPFYAINNHMDFYNSREAAAADRRSEAPPPREETAIGYSFNKFADRPVAASDTALQGLFVYPFMNKWAGLDAWVPGLGTLLAGLAIAGLVSWLWRPDGRMLLAILLCALVPFSMTWTVSGGAEWRLTLFAYAFYLVAAFWMANVLMAEARIALRDSFPRRRLLPLATTAAILLFGRAWTYAAPYAVTREALAQGAAATIAVGPRDKWLLAESWSDLQRINENVVARQSTGPVASVRIPLPDARPYAIRLRLDPVRPPATPQLVRVALDANRIAELDLGWNPQRFGDYWVNIPRDLVNPGMHWLTLESDSPFRLWYIYIAPQ